MAGVCKSVGDKQEKNFHCDGQQGDAGQEGHHCGYTVEAAGGR